MQDFEAFLKTNNFFTHPEFLKSIQLIITLHASTVHMNQSQESLASCRKTSKIQFTGRAAAHFRIFKPDNKNK